MRDSGRIHLFIASKGANFMNRFIIGLVAAVALVACIDTPADQTSSGDEQTFSVGGQTGTIVEGPGDAVSPLATYSESGVIAAGCRVVLDWCTNPNTGGPSCHFTNCTIERAVDACLDLIDDTCGFN
jgi:hypothetical protein